MVSNRRLVSWEAMIFFSIRYSPLVIQKNNSVSSVWTSFAVCNLFKFLSARMAYFFFCRIKQLTLAPDLVLRVTAAFVLLTFQFQRWEVKSHGHRLIEIKWVWLLSSSAFNTELKLLKRRSLVHLILQIILYQSVRLTTPRIAAFTYVVDQPFWYN